MKYTSTAAAIPALLSTLVWSGPAPDTPQVGADKCCAALSSEFPQDTYSSSQNTNLYQQSIASYFSVQDRLTPNCIIAPLNTQDVSKAVGILSKNSCQFAIRSGGHGLLVGSSNIVKGVTIDLSRMKNVTLSADKTVASVGAGAKWIDVYEYLDARGYAIPGGRAGGVGVGGLTTGGGNSFFAARYGFVCDNVRNFEVVLGTGEIVQANNKTNPDLFTALKGSQNNLGLITRFDIVAFPQGHLWGGTASYGIDTVPKQIEAFVDFTNNIEKDPYGSLIFNWVNIPRANLTYLMNIYEYTGKFANNATTFPPVFKDFSNTSAIGPPSANTLRIDSLSNLTKELNSPANISNLYATLTFTNNLTVLQHVVDIVNRNYEYYKQDPFYYYAAVQFQPLPRLFTQHSLDRGGNVLGLDRYHDNNIIFLLDVAWVGAQFDSRVRTITGDIFKQLTTYLRSVGALKDFQYINYAYEDQDPLGGYGDAALSKIKAASKKYDPKQVFQKLVPGGWKLASAGKGTQIGLA